VNRRGKEKKEAHRKTKRNKKRNFRKISFCLSSLWKQKYSYW